MKTMITAFLAIAFMAGNVFAQQGEQPKGALGIRMSDNTPGGVLVTKVVDGSPAAKVGLQAGDRILAINGQKTNNYRDVDRIVQGMRPSTPVELAIIRGAWKTNLKVALGSASAVFTPEHTFTTVAQPVHNAAGSPPTWSPFDFSDQGSAAAAYGGGGW
jgi:membrane-associated protease RseP (regulator of RpoE activity)